ncbi:MAG: SdrD B-like domain-containing protein, partial [Acidobacteriota bacterium]
MFSSSWSKLAIGLGLSIALGVPPGHSQTPTVTTGDELQVNAYTTGNQWFPSTSVLTNGDFVIVWQTDGSDNGDSSGSSVQGRRYTADGTPIGGQFLVNTYTTGSQERPAVASRPDGGFVVLWESDGSDGTDTAGSSIQGQRFDADGALLGAAFQVNTYTTSSQSVARVAVAADGAFVVVWTSDGSDNGDTSQESVQGQRFAADATPHGSQFLVNTYTTSQQTEPSMAIDADGDFVVVWRSLGSDNGDTSTASVQGQRFTADGSALGGQFLVNTYTSSAQEDPSVSMAPDGRFVVAWASFGSDNGDTSNHSVQAQRFDADGDPVGGELLVNTYTTSTQRGPSVAVDAAGDFVVTWRSYGSDNGDTSRNSVQGQRFTADGSPVGGQFLVNTFGLNNQQEPSVAASAAGDFVVAWHSIGSPGDTSDYAVLAQPFRVTADLGDRVFQDLDSDGLQSAPDLGAAGITVHLRDDLGDLVASTTTDSDGAFLLQPKIALQGVADELYLEFDPGPSSIFTTADVGDDDSLDSDADALGRTPTVTIDSAGTSRLDLDAGLIDLTPVIGDRVWHDVDLDGVQ